MTDPAAVEREVLALLAMSDGWLTARQIADRLRLSSAQVRMILTELCRAGEMDWAGMDESISQIETCYHLPFREVSFRRRIEVAS